MILKTPSFYKDFKCIAGDCPDSCCQGWEVDADTDSLEYYKTLTGGMKSRIDSVLDKDEFGNTIFRLTENKRCPFLNESNLCDMHIAIGGEHTPYTCRTFPRFVNDFGGTREMGLSFSCPVAAEMMWNPDCDFSFASEINDLPPSLNDIDAQIYFKLLQYRNIAYSIINDDTQPLNSRIIKLLDFAKKIQPEFDDYKEGNSGVPFIEIFKNPEVINNEWVGKVNNASFNRDAINSESCKNILMYFIFRYLLQAVFDFDVLSKVKMTAVGVLIPAFFGNDAWTIHLWSKETEHSDINMERFKRELRNNFNLSVNELKKYFYR